MCAAMRRVVRVCAIMTMNGSSRQTRIAGRRRAMSGDAFGPARSPHTSFAISRSLNFCTLPVEVLGNSANTT
jgi:hypothetical protein